MRNSSMSPILQPPPTPPSPLPASQPTPKWSVGHPPSSHHGFSCFETWWCWWWWFEIKFSVYHCFLLRLQLIQWLQQDNQSKFNLSPQGLSLRGKYHTTQPLFTLIQLRPLTSYPTHLQHFLLIDLSSQQSILHTPHYHTTVSMPC